MFSNYHPRIAPGGNMPIWGRYNPSQIVNMAKEGYINKGFMRRRSKSESAERERFELTSLMSLEGALTPQILNAISGYKMFDTADKDWMKNRQTQSSQTAPQPSQPVQPARPPHVPHASPISTDISEGEMEEAGREHAERTRPERHEAATEQKRSEQQHLYEQLIPGLGEHGAEQVASQYINPSEAILTDIEESSTSYSPASRRSTSKSTTATETEPETDPDSPPPHSAPVRRGTGRRVSKKVWETKKGYKYKSSEHDGMSWIQYRNTL